LEILLSILFITRDIYAVHNKEEVFEILESYRIGNLKVDTSKIVETNKKDAFQNDPKRHPLLKVLSQKPFNAESPKQFSADSLITPNKLHFVRNHLPVPKIDLENYELEIFNDLNGKKVVFKLEEFKKKFPIYTLPGFVSILIFLMNECYFLIIQ